METPPYETDEFRRHKRRETAPKKYESLNENGTLEEVANVNKGGGKGSSINDNDDNNEDMDELDSENVHE